MTDQSPLAEASPKSLDELFSTDPLKLSDSDVDAIIAELRRKRALWAKSEAEGRKAPRTKKDEATLEDLSL